MNVAASQIFNLTGLLAQVATAAMAGRLAPVLGHGLLIVGLVALGGCSYLEQQLQRTGQPDERVALGWQDNVSLYAREIRNYRCLGTYMLHCERAGSVTYSCTCVLR